jgi:aminopeptidase YwaD
LNPRAKQKIVITAHIDAYEDTPGALDNASGTVVLLLLAEKLEGYAGKHTVEIAAFNGEDHYSAGGQMDYLRRYGEEFASILLAVNIDDLGYKHGKSSYSFYGCPPSLEAKTRETFQQFKGLFPGEPWYQGDHMVFVQKEVPAITFTSEKMAELMRTITHTGADTPANIDCGKLVEAAEALNALIRSL